MKAKQRKGGGVLADVAAGMNEYFRSASVATNLTGCVFYVVVGLFTLVFAGAMASASVDLLAVRNNRSVSQTPNKALQQNRDDILRS